MTKAQTAAKNKYNSKAYDRLFIVVPKGRKRTLEVLADERGESVNGLTNRLYRQEFGISEEDWKRRVEE